MCGFIMEVFLVLYLPNTFEYGYKVNKRKRNEICKNSINKYQSRDRKMIFGIRLPHLPQVLSGGKVKSETVRSYGCKFGPSF